MRTSSRRRLCFLFAATAILAAMPAVVRAQDGGWELVRLDLEVDVLPDSARLRIGGTMHLRSRGRPAAGPVLVVSAGAAALDEVTGPGVQATLSAGRDSARVALEGGAGADSLVLRFRAHTLVALDPGRGFSVGREGAFASWRGNWYPGLAGAAGEPPALAAPGETRVRMPAGWHALAVGVLADSADGGMGRSETWRTGRRLARSFVAGPYVVSRHRVGAAEVAVYLSPGHARKAALYARAIPPMVEILERAYGPYPFESFAIADLPAALAPPGFGGRSEPGYFVAHTHALLGDSVNVPLFAHELAHMWWPNLVDSRPPGDDMVDEALASHGAALVVEATRGAAAARALLRDADPLFGTRAHVHLWRTGQDRRLLDDYTPLPARSKGPWIYQMLRERVGDAAFFGTLRALARERAGGAMSLVDLADAFRRAVPADTGLARFFADWLERPGLPVLDVSWRAERGADGPAARVTLRQRTAPYRLPLAIAVDGAAGTRTHRVLLADSVATFRLASAGAPTGVRLDPEHRLPLWERAFGPVPGVTERWSEAEFRAWLRAEVPWLAAGLGATAVAVAVVEDGRVAWAEGFGTVAPGGAPATAATRFDAAELARLPLALAALELARRGRLADTAGLDSLLRGRAAEQAELRRRLETLGEPAALAREVVLAPLGARADGAGAVALPRETVDPAAAAAFETSAAELGALLAALLRAAAGGAPAPLDAGVARRLLAPGADAGRDLLGPARRAGGGLRVAETPAGPAFHAAGIGAGHTALLVGFPSPGRGAVVLANHGLTGYGLAVQVLQRLAVRYGWPVVPGVAP